MIAYKSKINIFEKNEIFPNVLSKFGLHNALGIGTLDFIQFSFPELDIVFPELSFSFLGRNACLLCFKFIQSSYAILYKSMTQNDCI